MQQDLIYRWDPLQEINELVTSIFRQLFFYTHPSLPLHIRHELYEYGAHTGLHYHKDFYVLYIVQGGRGIHLINQYPYALSRGDVYLLPPGTTHAYQDYTGLAIDGFYFQPELFTSAELTALRSLTGFWHLLITLQATSQSENTEDRAEHLAEPFDYRLHLTPEYQHQVGTMIGEICSEFVGQGDDNIQLVCSQFFRLLVHLARWQALQQEKTRKVSYGAQACSTQSGGIAQVLQLCEERFHEPLTVPQLAASMFLSPSRFSELFMQEVGIPPAAYIRRLRLERAQTLLRTTQLNAELIAHQVGLRDSAQLARAFQAVFHLTPTAYRANFRRTWTTR